LDSLDEELLDGLHGVKQAVWATRRRDEPVLKVEIAGDWANRPAFSEMMTALLANGTRTVLVERLDRIARDLMVQESIIADFQRKGLTIVSVAEPDLCSDDPSRVLMRQILGAFFQYEKTMIVLKLRGARVRERATDGHCEGRKPYGARPGEAETVVRIQSLRDAGMAMDTIAETLNAEGTKPRKGSQWYGSSVRNVLLRVRDEGRPAGMCRTLDRKLVLQRDR
jgi:DNA invertase Pin-like site-specific DNA recombinase